MHRNPFLLALALPFAVSGCGQPADQPTPAKADTAGAETAASDSDALPSGTDAVAPDTGESADTAVTDNKVVTACKGAADCSADQPLCLAGVCTAKTPCTSDKQCVALNLVCDKVSGSCVQCNSATDCALGESCKANTCLPPAQACKSSKECPSGQVCHSSQKVCAECEQAGDCSPGQVCVDTVCAAPLCKPGQSQCSDSKTLDTCKADGSGWQSTACGSDQTCASTQCKAVVCEPKSLNCAGNLATACNDNGTEVTTLADCAKTGQLCIGGACVSKTCEAGAAICADIKTLATCKTDGSGLEKTPCLADKGCANGKCLPKICSPGSDSCNGTSVMHCNPSGTALLPTTDCAAQGKVCANGACATKAGVCVAGSKQCAGLKVQTCKADGSGWDEVNCEDANACTAEACASGACTLANVADGTACGGGMVCKAGVCAAPGVVLNAVGCPATGSGAVCANGQGTCDSGHCFQTDAKGYKWTLVPAGVFWMGCNAVVDSQCQGHENPQHEVELSAYWIGVYEITVGAYKKCMAAGTPGCSEPAKPACVGCGPSMFWTTGMEQRPLNYISFSQSQAVCNWLGGDLPTEAQWEKAARGGCDAYTGKDCKSSEPVYPWGNGKLICGLNAVFYGPGGSGCGTGAPFAVGTGSLAGISPYGAYDMSGNVGERTLDSYDATFYSTMAAKAKDPLNNTGSSGTTSRDASFEAANITPLRSSSRTETGQTGQSGVGVRCAKPFK